MELVRQKNVATYISFPLVDANGAMVTGATGLDSEIDQYADGTVPTGFIDCTNEATETDNGWYYLLLTQAEMNYDYIDIIIKSNEALQQAIKIRTMVGDPSLLATTALGALVWSVVARTITGGALTTPNDYKADVSALATSAALTTHDGKLDTVDDYVDTIEADLKTYMDAIETNLDGDIAAVKGDTAAILIDTDTIEADLTTEINANETKIDTVITNIGALNDLSSAEVQTVLENNDLDHLIQVTAGAEKPTVGTYLDKILNKDGSQTFDPTTDSLEKLAEASAPTAATIADAVWDEPIADHTTGTNFGGKNQKVVPSETIGDYKADVSALATEANATTNKNAIITEVDANETKIDALQANITDILTDTGTTLPTTLTSIEGKIDTIDSLIDAIKVIIDNIPADLEADIIEIKGTCGIWLVAEFTHDANNDNTIIEFWQYGNQNDFDNETKANAVNKWKQTTTFTDSLPTKAKFDKVS